jgi:glycosyltransferase involved in cell wall biosynthesis
VYNGENYLAQAIEAILAQTWEDAELVISDNGSTDGTQEICRSFLGRDRRIVYLRNASNIGASANYTRVFRSARGRYFRWAAHDDVCGRQYHERCLEVLREDAGVALCFAGTEQINAAGERIGLLESAAGLQSARPSVRLRSCLEQQECFMIWGVMRREVAARTRLLGSYSGHDRPFLAEMCLRGRVRQIDGVLYQLRDHPERSIRKYSWQDRHEAIAWYDPAKAKRLTFPWWRLMSEFVGAVRRAPISEFERARCYGEVARWIAGHRRQMLNDVRVGSEHLPMVGGAIAARRRRRSGARWQRQLKGAIEEIGRHIPEGERFLLIDENSLAVPADSRLRPVPFLEKDGAYAGSPTNDAEAVRELRRIVDEGVRYVVLTCFCFWWLELFPRFARHLQEHGREVAHSEWNIIFELAAEAVPMEGRVVEQGGEGRNQEGAGL